MNNMTRHGATLVVLAIALCQTLAASAANTQTAGTKRPKLVVGIVVDQMRYDYIPRFWRKFGDKGFKRLVRDGHDFTNTHFNYVPTYTGPGHTAIYTGATPSCSRIVANTWYDRQAHKPMYVVSDPSVKGVGTDTSAGRMSPVHLATTTITDELKTVSPASRVIALSIKDRAAILPGGHHPDGAFWYDGEHGNFVTSSYYTDKLPDWVAAFNSQGLARQLSKTTWNTVLPLAQYTESDSDDSPFERAPGRGMKPVFPYDLLQLSGNRYDAIKSTPFGNTLLEAFAEAAITGEQLGQHDATDFLAISFSSTDYVGHAFGPHSVELEDTYIRLDQTLAKLLSRLDETVGEGNYLLFLTADHGVVDVPQRRVDHKLPGGYFDSKAALAALAAELNKVYGDGAFVEQYMNEQVYLDRNLIASKGLSLADMQSRVAMFLRQFDGVEATYTATGLSRQVRASGPRQLYQNGFDFERSGDVFIRLMPGWLDSRSQRGTSHGSPYNYDTHVPLLFYGWRITPGKTAEMTSITQIAPTLASLLDIQMPDGASNDVIDAITQ